MNVTDERIRIIGTNTPAIWSAIRWIGACRYRKYACVIHSIDVQYHRNENLLAEAKRKTHCIIAERLSARLMIAD